jgi:hypothetical protein
MTDSFSLYLTILFHLHGYVVSNGRTICELEGVWKEEIRVGFVTFPATEYDEVLSGYQPGQMVER